MTQRQTNMYVCVVHGDKTIQEIIQILRYIYHIKVAQINNFLFDITMSYEAVPRE